jgi:hypothetical protein
MKATGGNWASGSPKLDYPGQDMQIEFGKPSMTLRDWFAGQLQVDDRLVKAVRAMDDTDLAIFAIHPDSERDDWIADADYHGLSSVEKIIKRLEIEARAIARVRYMQSDAMLKAREVDYE